MAQIIDGAASSDGFGAAPASVLRPWLVMGEQATIDSELYALSRAIDALSWEWQAAWQYNQALWWLGSGIGESVAQVMHSLQQAGLNIRRALSSWGGAIAWLNEHGDPQKVGVYQPLCQHVLAQQQRLDQSLARLQMQVTLLCQEWGLPLTVVPDLSGEVADGRNA